MKIGSLEVAVGGGIGAVLEKNLPGENWGSILEALDHGISVHRRNGQVLRANRRLADFYKLSTGDLIGRSCDELFHGHQEACLHEEVVQTRTAREAALALNDRFFRITLTPLLEDGGEIQGYLRLMTDVTREYQTRRELVRSARVFGLEQMISGMAHDIGTPLGIISGYAEYLLMKAKPEEPGNKELATILQQTKRVSETVQQMLDLVRPSLDRVDAISLSGFLSELTDLIKHHLKKISVSVELTANGEPPLVYGSAARLRQALFSLAVTVGEQIGQKGRLRMDLSAGTCNLNTSARIVVTGATASGQAFDFAPAFSCILSSDRDMETANMVPSVLALTSETLESFGAEVSSSDVSGQFCGLVIDLPANTPAQAGFSRAPQVR